MAITNPSPRVLHAVSDLHADGDQVEWNARPADAPAEADERVRFRLRCLGPGVWRLQTASVATGLFEDQGASQRIAAACDDPSPEAALPPQPVRVETRGTESWRVVGNKEEGGSVTIETNPLRITLYLSEKHTPATQLRKFAVSPNAVRVEGTLAAGEQLFGMGERFNGANQTGKTASQWAEDRWAQTEGNSYLPIPFLLSTGNWGLLVNRYEYMAFDLGNAIPEAWSFALHDNAPLDLYLFTADEPRTILQHLAQITGFAPEPPAWGFGVIVCRHARLKELGTLEGVREMVRQMDAHDLPWSVALIEGWSTYDVARYEDLKTIVDELHGNGKTVMMYEMCARLPEGRWADHGAEERFFVQNREDGGRTVWDTQTYNPADAPHKRKSSFLDITNPEAVAWWANTLWGRLLHDIGVDGAKIDFCEQFPEENVVLFDGSSPVGMHHFHPTFYNTLMVRAYQAARPGGGLCWSRGGGIGAQRYPFVWCGDQLREFGFLPAMLSASLSSGLSGIPFLCHDLAGYLPARDADANPEDHVFVRGTQLACFSPNMQTHGTVTRPYDFAPEIVDLYRLYSRIHYALVFYLQEQARTACTSGVPLMRHLFLHFPHDPIVWTIEDQYFLGEDLLIAPVLDDKHERDVYLPDGAWHDLLTGEAHNGGQTLRGYVAPLARTPVFVAAQPTSSVIGAALSAIRALWSQHNKGA